MKKTYKIEVPTRHGERRTVQVAPETEIIGCGIVNSVLFLFAICEDIEPQRASAEIETRKIETKTFLCIENGYSLHLSKFEKAIHAGTFYNKHNQRYDHVYHIFELIEVGNSERRAPGEVAL